MQLVKASRDALLKPLQVVSGIVERRQTLPILANILVRKDGERVSFTATDLEIQIQTSADIGAGKDAAATTVAARKLVDILRALPEADVALSLSNKKMAIASGRSRFNLQTLAAEEFPTVAQAEFTADFALPASTFKYLLSMVHFAMAQQDIRYYLNGMLLVIEKGSLQAVATDGHRLSWASIAIGGDYTRAEVILPRKTVLELSKLLADDEAPATIDILTNQIRFRFGSIELVSKVIDGKFPDYNRVIPTGYTRQITIDRSVLLHALQRAAILSNEKFRGVRLVLGLTAKGGFVTGNPGPFFRQLYAMGGTQYGIPLRGYDEFSITPQGYDPNASVSAVQRTAFGRAYFAAGIGQLMQIREQVCDQGGIFGLLIAAASPATGTGRRGSSGRHPLRALPRRGVAGNERGAAARRRWMGKIEMIGAHAWDEHLDLGNEAMDRDHHLQVALVSGIAAAIEQAIEVFGTAAGYRAEEIPWNTAPLPQRLPKAAELE